MSVQPASASQPSQAVSTGLRLTARRDADPPCLRVDWIAWDSGFRGSGLVVGDDIIAVDGAPVPSVAADAAATALTDPGGEAAGWTARGGREGGEVVLTVRRRRLPGEGWETLPIRGVLHAERTDVDAEGRRTLGPGGPRRLERDGFGDAWTAWYESRVFDWERQLGEGVWGSKADNRRLLDEHMRHEARVRFLAQRYPGMFADAVVYDWEAVRKLLAGRRYEVVAADHAYREADNRLVAEVTAAARAAWDGFLDAQAAAIIEMPPRLDLAAGDAERHAGKLLVLPPASPAGSISNSGVVMVSWFGNDGWVFTPLEAPSLDLLWHAQLRYRRNVSPDIADVFAVVGRILPAPRMVVPTGQDAVVGLEVEPVAALMGQGETLMFVDMLAARDGVAAFAGEPATGSAPLALPPDDASPRQVLEAAIAALHARDATTWFALFADWQSFGDDGRIWYYPYDPYPEIHRDSDWARSRRVVLEQSFALRVVWVDTPRTLRGDPALGLPVFEKVSAEIDHVGCFDGEFRAFNSIDVHRRWTLERRDGGPWRITSFQGI